VNGEVVAVTDVSPFEAWWPLEVGTYMLDTEVLRADGSTLMLEPVPFSVQLPPEPGSRNVGN
jgi:hypothetical protein